MKKLLSILGAVSLTATGASSVIACGGKKVTKVTKVTPVQQNLSDLIKTKDLGEIKFEGEIPDKRELLSHIKNKNKSANSLTENDFTISKTESAAATTTTKTIEIIGEKNYTGTVILQYTKK